MPTTASTSWVEMCRERNIEFVTNMRKDSMGEFNGCCQRGLTVLRKEIGEKEQKELVGYGERWKIECINSDPKRRNGDEMTARKCDHMAYETYRAMECTISSSAACQIGERTDESYLTQLCRSEINPTMNWMLHYPISK